MQDPLPLATIQNAVLEFLRDRDDAVLSGAQAVDAYVDEPRMDQGIDLLSTHAKAFVEDLCDDLRRRFHIAVRVQRAGDGRRFRVFQVRREGNRHLVDVRPIDAMPGTERIVGVLMLAPADLVASKVIAYHQRRGQPKSGTDWRDLALLLLAFPALKQEAGQVAALLRSADASPEIVALWNELAASEIRSAEEDDEF